MLLKSRRRNIVRIHELEISDVRGIRTLSISPEGQNTVIFGPNASGKSAVVDAIDFLLTGKISRLRGEGTGGITLASYGSHVKGSRENSKVSALISLPDVDDHIQIER
ncbi:MAG: AAA family ATPase, partial [Candidatus Lokiarchaeota archaeon]|nr:AAA family ATPase [Candidatus Lokiarchaeota archaeon]